MATERQGILDRYYFQHGPCCAGCDWWRHLNSLVGECTRSAPVSGQERAAALGIENISRGFAAGHVITYRDHLCGDFKDEFDWSSLSEIYRRRIGVPEARG